MTWRSKKQNVVSLSSAEAKYRALHHATTELTWLKLLLSELGFGPNKPMLLFCETLLLLKLQTTLCNMIEQNMLNLIGTTSKIIWTPKI